MPQKKMPMPDAAKKTTKKAQSPAQLNAREAFKKMVQDKKKK
jgi:hypothetical protein